MQDARASTSFQRLASTLYTLIESTRAEIATITVLRSEQLPGRSNRDIPVSVEQPAYGGKELGGGTSSNNLYQENELRSSSENVLGPIKDTRASTRMEFNFLKRVSQKYNSLVEKPKHIIRESEEGAGPKGKHPCGTTPKPLHARINLQSCQKKTSKPHRRNRRARKRQRERAILNRTRLILNIT
ncbi:hypothetical protein O181_119019 [Austropuccinia psidii MF-1]|uniref:Uncharacterized protein n=1 Tax=Austropuccinia psidii MF-1 TaxID=1389203 RepID=A0A9Q3PZ16_9BASI|nr:hypothetical protein [Austropuccinia psidii MF-1]